MKRKLGKSIFPLSIKREEERKFEYFFISFLNFNSSMVHPLLKNTWSETRLLSKKKYHDVCRFYHRYISTRGTSRWRLTLPHFWGYTLTTLSILSFEKKWISRKVVDCIQGRMTKSCYHKKFWRTFQPKKMRSSHQQKQSNFK